MKSRPSRLYLIAPLVILLVIVIGVGVAIRARFVEGPPPQQPSSIGQGSMSEPKPAFAVLASTYATGADFAAYANDAGRTSVVGQPIMPELPDEQHITQLCQNAMLSLTLGGHTTPTLQPLTAQLIAARADIPLVTGGSLTYAGLIPAADPSAQVTAPATWHPGGNPAAEGIFVPLGTRAGVAVGHFIPPAFAAYLVAHGGWQALAGAPLTEAVAATRGNQPAKVQAFANLVLVQQTASDGTTTITPRSLGSDWLSIFGRPTLNIVARTVVHVAKAQSILDQPAGAKVATFSTPFTAILIGDAEWQGTTLWYHVNWRNLLEERAGWLPANDITFGAPSFMGTEVADLNTLSPDLAKYVNGLGDGVALEISVPSQNRVYSFNGDESLEMASVVKVPILLTLLAQAEAAGRSLTGDEQSEAASMIEFSDNDAATALYDEEGGNPGLASFMSSIGISDFGLTYNGFGTSTISPHSMNVLLEDLRTASILTPGDCQYALSLMSQVTGDERMGLGDTAPNGATVQLKDGYGVEDDGYFVMDSSGILSYQGQVYEVSVFTRHETSQQQGTDYVNAICKDIALALVGQT